MQLDCMRKLLTQLKLKLKAYNYFQEFQFIYSVIYISLKAVLDRITVTLYNKLLPC